MGAAHTTATAPRQPMAALARGLGAACRISVARLRPAESDVRSMSSTRSKTVGAVRQVRGGAEAGFWVVCWVARGGARQGARCVGVSPHQEPHPRHATATIVTTEREYIPHMPPTRNILPRGSPHKRTPIGQRAGVSAVWERPGLVIVVHHNACVECPCSIRHRRRCFQGKTMITD